ncbi:MAG: alpha-amylase [Burkholderiales bacterium]|nr:alpha-amylase [Anaerolineae bacterium]
MAWPDKPIIYEINTWVWLNTLSRKYQKTIHLNNVPDETLDELAALNVDAIWLMGVWERSVASQAIARKYMYQYKYALPDVSYDDIAGSPYAIAAYRVDENLGGRGGLAAFRRRLRQRGLRLMLDFVPNHVASDHHWVREHPDYLVRGTEKDLRYDPVTFYAARDKQRHVIVVAHGRDPYFPGWSDTAQVNAFNPDLRRAIVDTLRDIGEQCDGVRCDMAMLLLNSVFVKTWAGYNGKMPQYDFWVEIIPQVKEAHPEFLFVAEAYWGLESTLQQQGFDYTYDKRLYDRILEGNVGAIRQHLLSNSIPFLRHSINFIENHDERRAYDTLGPIKSRPAATLICTLPGAALLHDGQFEAHRIKLPVQIGRQMDETPDTDLKAFYQLLLQETRSPIYRTGEWRLLDVASAWRGNYSNNNLLAYCWHSVESSVQNGSASAANTIGSGDDFRLIVINLTDSQAQGIVGLSAFHDIGGQDWSLCDVLTQVRYPRQGNELVDQGLYIDLPPFQMHIFRFEPAMAQSPVAEW